MEMRELVSLLETKIKMKLTELSRMEKEVAIAKSMIRNDIKELYKVLNLHYPAITEGLNEPENKAIEE
jgi:hypothetical protein